MKNYRLLSVCMCFLFFSPTSYAQELKDSYNRVSLSWGWGQLARQDQIFSPFIHRSSSPSNIAFKYERSKKLKQKVSLSISQYTVAIGDTYTYWWNDLEETFTTHPHSFILVDIDYGLAKTIWKTKRIQLSLGGTLQNKVQPSSYSFGSFGGFGYLATFGLGAWLEGVYQVNKKNQFVTSFSIPLVAWVARSPYLINDDEFIKNTYSHRYLTIFWDYLKDGSFQSIQQYQQMDVQLHYRYALNAKWDLLGGYYFSFIHYKQPAKFLSYQHQVSIGGSLKF